MKIKKMHLVNYRGYKDEVVEFEEGFNLVVGASDSGKSKLFEAIRFVTRNEPSSDDRTIREGAKRRSVEIEFYDGTVIKRTKGSGINQYEYKLPGKKKVKLDKFGKSVPEEIQEIFQLPIINVDDESYSMNEMLQHKSNKLLEETDQRKAKIIGALAFTEVVDKAEANSATRIRSQVLAKGRKEKEIKEKEETANKRREREAELKASLDLMVEKRDVLGSIVEEIKQVSFIMDKIQDLTEKLNRTIKKIEEIESLDIDGVIMDVDNLKDEVYKIMSIEDIIERKNRQLERRGRLKKKIEGIDVEKIEEIEEDIDSLAEEASNISKITPVIKRRTSEVGERDNIQKRIEKLEDVDFDFVLSNVSQCQLALSEIDSIESVNDKRKAQVTRAVKGQRVIERIKEDLDKSVEDYIEIINNMKKCPTCFSEVEVSVIDKIREELSE